ncbi:hypothetical protein, partial [Frankia sp. CpI1-P]
MPNIFTQHPDLVELDRQQPAAKLAPMDLLMAEMAAMTATAQDETLPFSTRLDAELAYAGATAAIDAFTAALRSSGNTRSTLDRHRRQISPGMAGGFDLAAVLIVDMLDAEL